ncbi:GtrA family protein [Corynebacterium tuberculostearicum]|uniref:GtrA family protein n=1 Tax=Corynebacterium tuberculostearicum TaxID=38304 RepID=UPI00344B1C7E
MGVIGAAIDFGTMHFLETSGANALIGRAISYILGSLFAYYANSVVTFSGNRSPTEKRGLHRLHRVFDHGGAGQQARPYPAGGFRTHGFYSRG